MVRSGDLAVFDPGKRLRVTPPLPHHVSKLRPLFLYRPGAGEGQRSSQFESHREQEVESSVGSDGPTVNHGREQESNQQRNSRDETHVFDATACHGRSECLIRKS